MTAGPSPQELAASRRRLWTEIAGIAVSSASFGLVYGLTARNAGFSPLEAMVMSLLVFAGASQFAAVGYVAGGLAWPGVVVLTALLNARHLLYSAALAPWLRDRSFLRRVAMAHVLTDEAFALSIAHFRRLGRADERGYWIAATWSTFIPWNLATLAGVAELYENNLFLSSLYEFLAVPRSVPEPARPQPLPRPWRAGLAVEKLCFRYPGADALILDGVDMIIRPGEVVALVGRNGSGKTTLTKLLCRLYDPVGGRITLDGVDLRDFATAELRREISVIYQDFGRYHLTARENILLGCPELSPEDPTIVAAARWAGIHDELMRLPQGYDTVMSRTLADGEELSVGQWQKLDLARAFVRNAPLIILDEPTSSLDAAAEFAFFDKFRAMAQGRSALIISHRFSTVRLADRIYVLDGGRLIEQGTHEALLALDGLYAQLYRRQASYYQDARWREEG